jgi:hypothetical protein
MTNTPVIGASPVTFISEDSLGNHGKQYQVPLSLLTFDSATGKIDTSGWPAFNGLVGSDKTLIADILQSLASRGLLTKPPS